MMPILLICCEGKTEEQYFKILRRYFRLPGARVTIIGEKGQHKALVDRTVEERKRLCSNEEIAEEEVECWAVCDDDRMPCTYKELIDYAEQRNVRVAFSRPQFEAYILQHFEQSREHRVKEIFEQISVHKAKIDGKPYTESSKSDLEWLRVEIDRRPLIIDVAITNSNQRKKRTGDRLFLTVQELTQRMQDLGI